MTISQSDIIAGFSLLISIWALWYTHQSTQREQRQRAREIMSEAEHLVVNLQAAQWQTQQPPDAVTSLEAVRLARQARQLAPNDSDVQCVLAECIALTQPEAAADLLENVLRRDADCHEAYCRLTTIRRKLGDLEAADRAMEGAIRTRGDCPRIPHQLFLLRDLQGRREDAFAAIKEACRIKPDDASVIADYGAALANAGHDAEAEMQLRTAISKGARAAGIYVNLGNVLVARGNHAEAWEMFKTAAAVNPDYVPALVNAGALAHNYADDAPGAERYFRQAIARDPLNSDALGNLAVVLEQQGRLEEARQAFETYTRCAAFKGVSPRSDLEDFGGLPALPP